MSIADDFTVQMIGARHLKISGDLDLSTASRLDAAAEHLLTEAGDVHVDATDLTFVDSSGLRALVRIGLRLPEGRLIIAGAPAALKRLFAIAGIEHGNRLEIRD